MKTEPSRPFTRRDFLKAAGRGLAGTGAGLLILSRSAGAVPANDKIVTAHIGVGGMGKGHMMGFARYKDVEVAALCDVDEKHCAEALQRLKKAHPDTKAKCYTDFRRVLERKDIDVVTCATPDHWHALVAILAFQAGKDVYGEKPLSHNVAEGRAMLRACRRYNRVFQLGTQIHAGENYHRVVELVRSGVLGKIHTVHVWKSGGSPNLPFMPDQPPPKTLNWDMWLGPAPWHGYNPRRCHHVFRYYWDYSGGVFADFWCHISDLVFWSLRLKGPTSVSARGEQPKAGMATTPAWIDVDYDFPNLKYYWTTKPPDLPGTEGMSIGAYFIGTKGSLVADYGMRKIFLDGKVLMDIPDVPVTIPRSPGHHRNFLDCVKTRELTESNLEYVHPMTIPMHLGNISYRLGRKLRWDPDKEQVIGDEAANRMLSRPCRAPWSLPA